MDKCSTDAEFDSYWENEAKNQNRNRIRVGRQYQATIPPLLKPGEKDGRRCEDLETLKWKPDQLSDQKLEEYMSMAKGISLFSKTVSSSRTPEKSDNSLQSAIKGLTEFVASHHPCHHDDGCRQVPTPSSSNESSKSNPNSWSPSEAQLFAQALEACGKNFSAIKKEFLPWKPVRSIIEYYYQTKSEKDEDKEPFDKIEPKDEEEEPIPSCSYEEKPFLKDETHQVEESLPDNTNEDPPKDSINFLDHSRVTDPCSAASETSSSHDTSPSSTIGSLKFFLGGRLVLKLNAQQDGGSGNKCQWVQSNDLPKLASNNKKDRHKKKFSPYGYFSSTSGNQKLNKNGDDLPSVSNSLPDSDTCGNKKSKHKKHDSSENSTTGLLLCSSSWTPPVADGQESIEVDDCSSKTSEGYVSPILSSNSRMSKTDSTCNSNPLELGELKCDSDPSWTKIDNCVISDSASKNASVLSGKNSPNQSYSSPLKKEVLNHKSALSHGRSSVKSPCYQSRSSHSNSSLLKQRNKWSNSPYPLKSSPSSLSPVYVDLKNSLKETALDLSSKSDNDHNSSDHLVKQTHSNERSECSECILCESDSRPDSDCSPQSSNLGSHTRCAESPRKESCIGCNCCEGVSTDQSPLDNSLRKEENDVMASKESDDNSQLSYSYCNLPYHCALPKCTKDYTLEEHLCNKNSDSKNQVDCQEYIIHDIDESICEKNPNWCSKTMSSYYPYYSHCYPYYVNYGTSSQNSAESTDTEAPLDLSSANETKIEKLPSAEKVSENSKEESSQNAESGGRGMLYQLLKNKSK